MEESHDFLRLTNQLCFPLYTASRLITQCYHPILEKFGLTYTQYLVLLVLWEKGDVSLREISKELQLQSNTLTPLLKRMQVAGLLKRVRSSTDERSITISLTEKGKNLKADAMQIPTYLKENLPLSPKEASQLYGLLHKLIATFK